MRSRYLVTRRSGSQVVEANARLHALRLVFGPEIVPEIKGTDDEHWGDGVVYVYRVYGETVTVEQLGEET